MMTMGREQSDIFSTEYASAPHTRAVKEAPILLAQAVTEEAFALTKVPPYPSSAMLPGKSRGSSPISPFRSMSPKRIGV